MHRHVDDILCCSYLRQLLGGDQFDGVVSLLGPENLARIEQLYAEIIDFRECPKEDLPIKVTHMT